MPLRMTVSPPTHFLSRMYLICCTGLELYSNGAPTAESKPSAWSAGAKRTTPSLGKTAVAKPEKVVRPKLSWEPMRTLTLLSTISPICSSGTSATLPPLFSLIDAPAFAAVPSVRVMPPLPTESAKKIGFSDPGTVAATIGMGRSAL